MRLILFFAVALTFAFGLVAFADDAKTQPAKQTSAQPSGDDATAPAPASGPIKAKALYDGKDSNAGDDATVDTGQTDGGQKVAPGRAPSGGSGDFPYSEEEMRQADPGFNTGTKNMPVDQD